MREVAIVVVTYNSADSIAALLGSIAADSPGGEAAVVVVDNDSTDETLAEVARFGWVQVVRSANHGYAAGINRGVEATPDARAHLILNPDLVVRPGAIAGLLAQLADPRVGIVAPLVLGGDGTLERSLRRTPTLPRALGLNFTGLPVFAEYVTQDSAYAGARDVDWALGAALLVRRDCGRDVGAWDESYFLYSEETDYCERARAAGWLVRYTPDATVVHTGGGSGRNDRTHVMQIVNKVRFYARSHSRPAAWAYWAATVASELTWIVRGHPQSRASVRALLRPATRPEELGCSDRVLPV
jgi:GT2 family glycosyltransferase